MKKMFAILAMITWPLMGCSASTVEQHSDLQGLSGADSQQIRSTYKVRGKRYHVLKTSHNFRERGYASWYGSRFQHRRTSSGERFNKNALTAAHKNLPLNSYVKVKNLENGREVIVKVNDRGPFAGRNRIIDLSYLAAKRLGLLSKGRGLVEVKALG